MVVTDQIRKSKQPKIQQNKTTLVQLPLTTFSQKTRWAYSTTLPSPHGAEIQHTIISWPLFQNTRKVNNSRMN